MALSKSTTMKPNAKFYFSLEDSKKSSQTDLIKVVLVLVADWDSP